LSGADSEYDADVEKPTLNRYSSSFTGISSRMQQVMETNQYSQNAIGGTQFTENVEGCSITRRLRLIPLESDSCSNPDNTLHTFYPITLMIVGTEKTTKLIHR
jgi:hypothetical protein